MPIILYLQQINKIDFMSEFSIIKFTGGFLLLTAKVPTRFIFLSDKTKKLKIKDIFLLLKMSSDTKKHTS